MNRTEICNKLHELAVKYDKLSNPGDGYSHDLVLNQSIPIPEEGLTVEDEPDAIMSFYTYEGNMYFGTENGWDIDILEEGRFSDEWLTEVVNILSDEKNFEVD